MGLELFITGLIGVCIAAFLIFALTRKKRPSTREESTSAYGHNLPRQK